MGLFSSFMAGFREARAGAKPWSGITIVAVGDPDPDLLVRLALRTGELLATDVEIDATTAIDVGEHDRDTIDGPQWDAEPIGDALAEFAANPRVVLGVTDVDLFAQDLSFVFGSGRDGVALVSYDRFVDDPDLLDYRVTKQALSSIGGALGVERCEDETCVRVYPNSLEDHDAKQLRLCAACRAGFELALAHPVAI